MALGKRLKEARTQADLTQGQLAERVGMTQAAIGALETRDSQRSSKAAELADALGVSLLWLVSGKGPMNAEEARNQQKLYDEGEAYWSRLSAFDSIITDLKTDGV